jgi:hypothetical protein
MFNFCSLVSGCEHLLCSTSLPGGNQVDGLPPVSNTAARDISESIGPVSFAFGVFSALNFTYVYVVIIAI